MTNTDSQLRDEIERNEGRAHFSAWMIVFGLVAEAILAIWLPAGKTAVENWSPVISSALIALGVWGEIHFGGKAARDQKSLQAITEQRLTEALDRASAAQLELAKFRTPRASLISGESKERLVDALAPFAGTVFDVGFGEGDGEQADFVWLLEESLAEARWSQCAWGVHAVGIASIHRNRRPLAGSVGAQNVEIHLEPTWRRSRLQAAEALIDALKRIGIAAKEAPYNTANTNVHAMHILIGPKQ